MGENLKALEKAILKSKGVTDENLAKFEELEITSKESFAVIGNAQTLVDISGISMETAQAVMAWAGVGATGAGTDGGAVLSGATIEGGKIVVEDSSVIKCTHCEHKQPHDYQSGDLCPNCGKQAEPMAHCYWCYNTGTGKFCRQCGAEFVKNLDYEIAVLLKKEGVAKREIAKELAGMEESEKESRLTQLRSGRY